MKFRPLNIPVGDHGGGGDIPHRLQHAQQIDGARQHKGVKVEGETVLERDRHRNKRQVLKGGKIHHAEHQGHRITRHQTDGNAAHPQQRASAAVEGDDDTEHQKPQPDVLVFAKGAAAHGGEAAAKVDDPHLDKAQANHQNHYPTHGRGDHPLEVGQHKGGAHYQKGTDKGDPEQGRDNQLLMDAIFFHGAAERDHHGDEGEVDRLDGEQPRTDGAITVHLQPGADTGGDHRHGDQIGGDLGG